MKRIKIVGPCLVAVFASVATLASTAQAAEVKSCVKAAKVTIKYTSKGREREGKITEGRYKNRNCSVAASEATGKHPPYEGPEGKYEWGSAGSLFSTKSGPALKKPKLEMAGEGGRIVQCTASSGKGEWTGPTTGVETVVFKGCVLNTNKEQCTSGGLAAGDIETAPLALSLIAYPVELEQFYYGENNEITSSEPWQPLPGRVWVESAVEPGHSYYTEYACGPVSFRTVGTVTGRVETPLNTMAKKATWYVGPGQKIQDLSSEYSTDGGSSWMPVGGSTVESYEAAATDGGGIEVVEE